MIKYRVFSIPKKSGGRKPPSNFVKEFIKSCIEPGNPDFVTYFNRALCYGFDMRVMNRILGSRIGTPTKAEIEKNAEKLAKICSQHFFNISRNKSGKNKPQWKMFHLMSSMFSRATEATENMRVIIAPDSDTKSKQRELLDLIGRIKVHPSAFGFVHEKSALDCAKYHLTAHEQKVELLVNVDIKNFFGSVAERDLIDSLAAHRFTENGIKHVVDTSTIKLTKNSACEFVAAFCMSAISDAEMMATINEFSRPEIRIRYGHALPATFFRKFFEIYIGRMVNRAVAEKWIVVEYLEEMCRKILNLGGKTKIGNRFLPQGAPTSPALSNLAFKRMDFRLSGLAQKHGAIYSRYADDLSFTWDKRMGRKSINLFVHTVSEILKNGNFELNRKKTRVVGTGGQMDIVGYVINSGSPTVSKEYRDKVRKMILDAESKARSPNPLPKRAFNKLKSQIRGKIAFIKTACPQKAAVLESMFNRLDDLGLTQHRFIHVDHLNQ